MYKNIRTDLSDIVNCDLKEKTEGKRGKGQSWKKGQRHGALIKSRCYNANAEIILGTCP